MDKDRCQITSRILNLTLEIIYLLTGKEYTEVKTSSECVTPNSYTHTPGDWRKPQSPDINPPPNSLVNDKNNVQRILNLTNEITELLTGEVPLRCQDVAVYFSMEESEFLDQHKDLYKDILMEEQQPFPSPDGSLKKNEPKKCSGPVCSQDGPEEKQIHQVKDLADIKVEVMISKEETCVWGSQQCKEETIQKHISPADDSTKGFSGRPLTSQSSGAMFNVIQENSGENSSKLLSVPHERDALFDSEQTSVASSQTVKQIQGDGVGDNSEQCGKNLKNESNLSMHKKVRKPFSCSECGKCFTRRFELLKHLRTHTEERPFSCLECGKSFKQKSYLNQHQRVHTGENLFSCLECGKRFTQKMGLVEHHRVHTGEKPFSCSDCGKSFTTKSNLRKHQKKHKIERSFSCPQCGMSFPSKSELITHRKSHTNKKFQCSECGKQGKS